MKAGDTFQLQIRSGFFPNYIRLADTMTETQGWSDTNSEDSGTSEVEGWSCETSKDARDWDMKLAFVSKTHIENFYRQITIYQ